MVILSMESKGPIKKKIKKISNGKRNLNSNRTTPLLENDPPTLLFQQKRRQKVNKALKVMIECLKNLNLELFQMHKHNTAVRRLLKFKN